MEREESVLLPFALMQAVCTIQPRDGHITMWAGPCVRRRCSECRRNWTRSQCLYRWDYWPLNTFMCFSSGNVLFKYSIQLFSWWLYHQCFCKATIILSVLLLVVSS